MMDFVIPNDLPGAPAVQGKPFYTAYASSKNSETFGVWTTAHMLMMLEKGEKIVTHQGKEHRLGAGDALLLSQGSYFMRELIQGGEYRSMLVFFDDTFVLELMARHDVTPDEVAGDTGAVTVLGQERMGETVAEFARTLQEEGVYKEALLRLGLETLLLRLLTIDPDRMRAFFTRAHRTAPSRLKYLLEENLDRFDSVEDMAAVARLSAAGLRRETERVFNMKPKEWLTLKKLEKAAQLLKVTDKSVAEIAADCAFATPSWFGHQFRRRYGATPHNYREQNR